MKLQTTDFRFVEKLDKHDHYTDANGVIRWTSNNSVPPIDILELAYVDGKISEQTLKICLETKSGVKSRCLGCLQFHRITLDQFFLG